jgi:hypothetical protein
MLIVSSQQEGLSDVLAVPVPTQELRGIYISTNVFTLLQFLAWVLLF